MPTVFDLLNPDSTEVEEQRVIKASGGATGDVLTQQADGTYAPAEGGGSLPVNVPTLVGPFPLAFNTAGLVNPDFNGIATIAVPAGSVVLAAFPIFKTDWTGSETGDTLRLNLVAATNGSGADLGIWDMSQTPVNAPTVSLPEPWPFSVAEPDTGYDVVRADHAPCRAVAVAACSVFASVFTNGTITDGTADVYALLATPL